MKLIVGLGNPGREYEKTRHNCGFKVLDAFVSLKDISYKNKFNAQYAEYNVNNEKIILVKPLSYMNLSGDVVEKYVSYYNIDLSDLLIIYDDKDLEVGKFRLKKTGTSAGHNGIKDIIQKLKTNDINRLKVGISKNNINLSDYVLGKFSKEDENKINEIIPTLIDVINDFILTNIDEVMNKYNGLINEK